MSAVPRSRSTDYVGVRTWNRVGRRGLPSSPPRWTARRELRPVRLGVIANVSAVPRRLRRQPPRRWRNRFSTDGWRGYASSARPAIATSSRCCPSSIRPRPRCCPRSSDLLSAQAMDPRHRSGVGEPQTSRRLPRGVYLPFQPPSRTPHNPRSRAAPRYRHDPPTPLENITAWT